MMKSLLTILLFTTLTYFLHGQSYFYGGYGIGYYLSKEAPAENMCTKFNLGWEIGINEDECLVTLLPGTKNYTIDNQMNWNNLPHGFRFGGVYCEDVLGFQVGMNYMNQRSGGKRTDLSTNTTEQFSLKTRMGLFTMNFLFMKNPIFHPFVGFDFGYSTFRFSYDNGSVNYDNQRMGYNIKLGGGNYVPGDKSITIGFNAGCSINLYGSGPISMKMVPSYQYILTGTGEINQVVYPDLIFNHSNVSLSFLLTYNIGQ